MTDAAVAARTKRKPGPKSKPGVATAAPPPAPGNRGGARPGSGRKNSAVEAATADAHIVYQKARAQKEAYQAKLAELDYKVKSGEYLPRADVQQAAATAFSTIAQALRSIPDSLERRLGISAELAEEIGLMIDEAMNDLANDLERMHEE